MEAAQPVNNAVSDFATYLCFCSWLFHCLSRPRLQLSLFRSIKLYLLWSLNSHLSGVSWHQAFWHTSGRRTGPLCDLHPTVSGRLQWPQPLSFVILAFWCCMVFMRDPWPRKTDNKAFFLIFGTNRQKNLLSFQTQGHFTDTGPFLSSLYQYLHP